MRPLTDTEIVGQAADRFHDECYGNAPVPCESCGDYPADHLTAADSLYCYLCTWSALEHGHLHGDD